MQEIFVSIYLSESPCRDVRGQLFPATRQQKAVDGDAETNVRHLRDGPTRVPSSRSYPAAFNTNNSLSGARMGSASS